MRLLICTQTIDSNDPVLGFFHRWIKEFAKHCDGVEVICLREGKHALPVNVSVHSLRKEKKPSHSFIYALRFWRALWKLRGRYDAVFVHMNSEYVLLGAPFWKLSSVPVALWYTHKHVPWHLRLAEKIVNIIFTASSESFRLASKKVRVTGHGIDTDFFTPSSSVRTNTILSVGRLTPSKRHELVLQAAAHTQREVQIVGDGSEKKKLEHLADSLGIRSRVEFLGPLSQEKLKKLYQTAGVLMHTSETGSLDKVVLEALACGLPVVTTDSALTVLPVVVAEPSPASLAHAISFIKTPPATYVHEHHSLSGLVPKILGFLQSNAAAAHFYQTFSAEVAHTYEKGRWAKTPIAKTHREMHEQTLRQYVSPLVTGAKNYLEIGPGPGTWSKVLLEGKKEMEIVFADISTSMLQEAAAAISPLEPSLEVGNFLQWDKKGREFDVVFSSRAIEYFSDKQKACEKIVGALRIQKTGAIITKHPHHFREGLLGRSPQGIHGGQIPSAVLVQHLSWAGAVVESVHPVTMTFPLLRSPFASRVLWRTIGRFPLSWINAWATESYLVLFKKV